MGTLDGPENRDEGWHQVQALLVLGGIYMPRAHINSFRLRARGLG